MFFWTVSNSDVLLDPPSFHFPALQKIKVGHLYNQPGGLSTLISHYRYTGKRVHFGIQSTEHL